SPTRSHPASASGGSPRAKAKAGLQWITTPAAPRSRTGPGIRSASARKAEGGFVIGSTGAPPLACEMEGYADYAVAAGPSTRAGHGGRACYHPATDHVRVETIAVVGSGLMGRGIAHTADAGGFRT